MIIHTYVYNKIKINLLEYENYMIWDFDKICDLIKTKYKEWEIYFSKLILNKSRENLIKYIVIKEFGGGFVNIELLKLFTQNDIKLFKEYYLDHDMIFWLEQSNNLTKDIFEIDDFIINDDIFIIKNKSNSFVNFLLDKIDKTIIPSNEYKNKIFLGNIFISMQLSNFYKLNLNIELTYNNSWFSKNLSTNFKLDNKNIGLNKFENSIYLIKLNNFFPFNIEYKLKIYPNLPELQNPEKILNSWDSIYRIKNYVESMLIIIVFQNNNLMITLLLICLIVLLNYHFKEYLKKIFDVKIKSASIDSTVFFNPKKFKFFRELQKNWLIIRNEAMNIMLKSPKLNISRTIYDWYSSKSYFESIKNKHGWIRSWKYNNDNINDDIFDENNKGNYEWLNFGLLYFGNEFIENVKQCPKTFEFVNKIKQHINICGFSWMHGGCILLPHTDETGLINDSLAMHIGLDIPKPNNSCKLVIKNEEGEFIYINEENGKIIVFDATFEHYAYNLTNQDRLILYIDFKI